MALVTETSGAMGAGHASSNGNSHHTETRNHGNVGDGCSDRVIAIGLAQFFD